MDVSNDSIYDVNQSIIDSNLDKHYPIIKQKDMNKLKKELWTRVVDVSMTNLDDIILHTIKDDLLNFQTQPIMRRKRASASWKLLYDPKKAEKDINVDNLASYLLDEPTLAASAVKITTQRKKLRAQALDADSKVKDASMQISEVSTSLASRIIKGYHSSKKPTSNISLTEQIETVPIGLRKKIKRKTKLDSRERLDIGFRIIVKNESQADLAKELYVSRALISQVVNNIKRKPEILREAISKRHDADELEEQVADEIQILDKSDKVIKHSQQILDHLKEKGLNIEKTAHIRRIMKNELDMSYRKIIKQSVQTNSIVNRILRQQCSMKLFGYVKKGY